MLRCKINSANDRPPGGPVSSVADANESFDGATTTKVAKAKSTGEIWSATRAGFFAEITSVARKILQHGASPDGLGLGADCFAWWYGQPPSARFTAGAGAAVASAQWLEMASQAQNMTKAVEIAVILRALINFFNRPKEQICNRFRLSSDLGTGPAAICIYERKPYIQGDEGAR